MYTCQIHKYIKPIARTLAPTMRRKPTESHSSVYVHPINLDGLASLELRAFQARERIEGVEGVEGIDNIDDKLKCPMDRGNLGGLVHGRRRARRCWRVSCVVLCWSLVISLIAVAFKINALFESYGYNIPYFLVAPAWWRWLTEPAPLLIGYEGAVRSGEFWVSRVANTPNVTIVHNFMSNAECAKMREIAMKMGLVPGTEFKVGNAEGGWAVAFNAAFDVIYNMVRTSTGIFIELEHLLPSELATVRAIMRRAERVTGLHLGNFEKPFIQHYSQGDVFRAHYDMYQVDMTQPFPFQDNMRSSTLLAYLADMDDEAGGETEFLQAEPRPLLIRPREGAAVIWSNCLLEDKAAVDDPEPWDGSKCKGGGGDHGVRAYHSQAMKGEHVQQPCCVARDENSIHQSRAVRYGHEKWTMSIWMRQRFTDHAETYRAFGI
jgi:hypothetical protein